MKHIFEIAIFAAFITAAGVYRYEREQQDRALAKMKEEVAILHQQNEVATNRIEMDEEDVAKLKLQVIGLRRHNGETIEEILK